MKLSIVIPAHNEENRLPPMLEAYATYFWATYADDAELIVVPNFCSDRTTDVALQFSSRFTNVRVLDDPGRVGKGGAVICGAQAARGDLVGFVDADGSTSPKAFNDLVEQIGDAGCIIASRWMKGALVSPKQPISRRVASRCFNRLVNVMFGIRVTDTQCGAKLLRREVLLPVMSQMGVTCWAFDVDMLFQVKRLGSKIREIPTVWCDVAGSKIRVFRASVGMLVAMVRLRMFYSPLRGLIPPISKVINYFFSYWK